MPPEDDQLEIEFPDEDYFYSEPVDEIHVVEYGDTDYGFYFPDEPEDIDWDYGDDSEDQEFMSE